MVEIGEKTKRKVQEIIKRKRKKKKRINEIKIKEWKEYFMKLLSNVEERILRRRERRKREQEESDLKIEESKMLRNLKINKAIEIDGILNEKIWWRRNGKMGLGDV